VSYHEQVRRNYLAQATDDPRRFRVVNADRPVEEVATDVWREVSTLLRLPQ